MPSTVFFTGHMIDRPDRVAPRFPAARAPDIARRIACELEAVQATDGFASAACGGDILFLEAIIARGGKAHVTLPCAVEAFRRDCVDIIPGSDWSARFDRILEAAHSVEVLGEQYASDNSMASECCNRVMAGLAERCAQSNGAEVVVIALWDGRPGDAVGGTHSTVEYCVRHGFKIRLMMDLSPAGARETRELTPAQTLGSAKRARAAIPEEAPQQICAVVFADAVGFSKLREQEVPRFVEYYLSCAMRILQATRTVPLVKNTWGDGLYLVFESVQEAGQFAVNFRDSIVSSEWRHFGLSNPPNVRIGVHAGPLYRFYDPVIGQWSYIGSHVTRAARLEPSADVGKVFASLSFVALAAAERVTGFTSRPVGRRMLVKNAGELELFELESVNEQR
jgi:class 3 adenylate cyclase